MNYNDCFDEILEFYYESSFNNHFKISESAWIKNSKYLMKLMRDLEKSDPNYERIRNCLIFLINLCFGIENPDMYYLKGKSIQDLNHEERKDYINLLKTEYAV